MLLSYDPDKISFLKILLKTIPNLYNTKFMRNMQLLIKKINVLLFYWNFIIIYIKPG